MWLSRNSLWGSNNNETNKQTNKPPMLCSSGFSTHNHHYFIESEASCLNLLPSVRKKSSFLATMGRVLCSKYHSTTCCPREAFTWRLCPVFSIFDVYVPLEVLGRRWSATFSHYGSQLLNCKPDLKFIFTLTFDNRNIYLDHRFPALVLGYPWLCAF